MTSKNPAVVKVLQDAKELIKKGWTKKAYARDLAGKVVDPWSHAAVCWCARGAIMKAAGLTSFCCSEVKYHIAVMASQAISMAAQGEGEASLNRIITANDDAFKAETVLVYFDKAITIAEERMLP